MFCVKFISYKSNMDFYDIYICSYVSILYYMHIAVTNQILGKFQFTHEMRISVRSYILKII